MEAHARQGRARAAATESATAAAATSTSTSAAPAPPAPGLQPGQVQPTEHEATDLIDWQREVLVNVVVFAPGRTDLVGGTGLTGGQQEAGLCSG